MPVVGEKQDILKNKPVPKSISISSWPAIILIRSPKSPTIATIPSCGKLLLSIKG